MATRVENVSVCGCVGVMSIGPNVLLSTVALGGGDMYQLPGWDCTPKPTATVVPLASVRATCADGKHSTYDWALLMPIRKPGVLETYYHYVVEFALPLMLAIGRPSQALLLHTL